jgi:hypothetical protein
MTLTPISVIPTLAPGTVLAGVRGVVKAVGEHYADIAVNPDGTKRPWSVQTLILTDKAGAEVAVEIVNKPAVPASAVGKGLCLLSTENEHKRLFGVKVDAKELLRLTAKGELHWVEAEVKQPEPKPISGSDELRTSPSATEGGAKAQAAPLIAPGPISGSGEPGPTTDRGPKAAVAPLVAPGSIPNSDAARIMALVLLYDRCLAAVLTGVAPNTADNSGFLMAPEGVHAATRAVFEAVLREKI